MSAPPRVLDFHSHWGTEQGWKGSPYDSPEAREAVRAYFKWDMQFVSEEEQAAQFRRANAKVMLDLAHTYKMDVGAVRDQHDYAFDFARKYPDVVLGIGLGSIRRGQGTSKSSNDVSRTGPVSWGCRFIRSLRPVCRTGPRGRPP